MTSAVRVPCAALLSTAINTLHYEDTRMQISYYRICS